MDGIELIIKRIFVSSAEHIFEEILGLRTKEKTDIYIEFFCCSSNTTDMFFGKISMYAPNKDSNVVSFVFVHDKSSMSKLNAHCFLYIISALCGNCKI